MGWLERLKSTSRPSKEAVALSVDNEEEAILAPPQTRHVAYSQDDGEQSTFERPGAPRMVRSTRSESSTAFSCSTTVPQQHLQASCNTQQLEEDASTKLSTTCGSRGPGTGPDGPVAAAAQQQQQLQDLQQHAAAVVGAAAEARVDLAGLQQILRTLSSPAAVHSNVKHRPPARHASIDAGYVQHRAMTAVTSLSCYPPSRGDSTCSFSGTAAAAAAAEVGCPRTLSNLSNVSNSSGSNVLAAGATASNDDIEIGWVWPPCLASDAGPVEFAVNVAPAEWLSGKRSLTRVPCWPVSGLSLHIVHGEQLLQVVDIDICGTTTVRLQLPPSLTSSNELNFIMVMLVDHGKVGPATQLLTMPSAAADEFCGLFSMLVEHEMLPRSAAHPEFVSLLFGSSGCSSASTLPTVSGKLAYDGDAAGGQPSCAPAVACWDAGKSAADVLSPRQSQLHKHQQLHQHTVAPVALLQGSGCHRSGSRTGRQHHHRRRRHSTTLCIAARPSVVQKWSGHTAEAGSTNEGAGTQGSGTPGSVPAAGRGSRRERRASDSDALLHVVPDSWTIDEQGTTDFSSLTGQTLTMPGQSNFDHGVVDNGRVLSSSPAAATVAEAAEIETATYTNDSSAGRETLADELESVSTNAAATNAAQVAGLMFFVDDGDASSDCTSVAVPIASLDKEAAAAAAAAGDQHSRHSKFAAGAASVDAATAATGTQTGSRKSLSLDRCAMHVHNEMDRSQRTRSRLSLDEGIWRVAASRAANRADGGGWAAGGPATTRSSWIATGLLEGMWSRMGLQPNLAGGGGAVAMADAAVENSWSSYDASAAAAAGAAAASRNGPIALSGVAAAAAAGGGGGADMLPAAAVAIGSSSISAQGDAAAAAATAAAAAAAPKLERRSAAEANMAAAFTAAWTRHMLELASDLQYLVVCVPWAFAGHFEAWFGRIVNARGSAEGRDYFLAQQKTQQQSESTWDSAMYMRRLGEVMDTLQMHKMWVTMSLLLQHCWQGGLDLYPAGQLLTHLQQQQQQQWAPYKPLDPDLFSPDYLQQIGRLNIAPASGWIRPVPADPKAADQKVAAGNLGLAAAAAAAASTRRSSFSSAADLSKGLAAERAAAAAATNARRRSVDQPASSSVAAAATCSSSTVMAANSSSVSQGSMQQKQQQRLQRQRQRPSSSAGSTPDRNGRASRHHPPRRSVSWPLGVLNSALSWAQNAQRKHRQRTTWQRAWQLHTLQEESERGSTSSACTSSFDTYRSSTSTTRSSCVAVPAANVGLGNTAAAAAAAAAARSSRGSVGMAAAAASMQAQPTAAAAGSPADPIVQQQQLQQLQQLLACRNAALALATASGASAGRDTLVPHVAAARFGTHSADNQLLGRPVSAAAASSPALQPAWPQQQQLQCWQQQRGSEPGGGLPDDRSANHRDPQRQQPQLQDSYQRWHASDTAPAHWPSTSYTNLGLAGDTTMQASYTTVGPAGDTTTWAASYTAGHTCTGGPVTSGGIGGDTATAISHTPKASYASSRSVDAVLATATSTVDQQRSTIALQSSLYGPAPLPEAKVQGLQAGLFAQAKLPEQQLQLLKQQQREREQLAWQQQQSVDVVLLPGSNGSESLGLQQQQKQESKQAALVAGGARVDAAMHAAALQAAAVQAAVIQAAATQAATAQAVAAAASAARASNSSRDDGELLQQLQQDVGAFQQQQQHDMQPVQQQQQDPLGQVPLPGMLTATRHGPSHETKRQQQHVFGSAEQQQQQQQGRMSRPSFDYAPHTPRENQPHPSYDRALRSSCDQQQQQRSSVDVPGAWSTNTQQQRQQQRVTAHQSFGLLQQQRQVPVRSEAGASVHAPVAAANVEQLLSHALPAAAAAAAASTFEPQQPASTSTMLVDTMCSEVPGPTESAVHGLEHHADSSDQAVQQASLSDRAVQSLQPALRRQLETPMAAGQGKYEAQAAAAAAAAVETAAVLAAATRIEQAVGQLLMVLVLLYCLCYLPSLLPGQQPQHIESAMAARPGWFEPVLLVLLAVHLYMGQTLVTLQAGVNPSEGSTSAGADASSSGSSSTSAVLGMAAAETTIAAGPGARDDSFSEAAAAGSKALRSIEGAQQQQQQQQLGVAPTKKQQRQERQRQRRRLARQQVLLLRCVLSVAAGAAAAGMSCYSLWLFWQSSHELWQQHGWATAAQPACNAPV